MTIQTNLSLRDYQDLALKTAEPRAFQIDYLVPGIVGEIGELFGQKAKSFWHGWTPERLQEELVSEYGDICWMTATLLYTRGVDQLNPSFPDTTTGVLRWGTVTPELSLLSLSHQLYTVASVRDDAVTASDQWLEEVAERLWRQLRASATAVTGVQFQDILRANLQKLADRAARGVLRGSGDHR